MRFIEIKLCPFDSCILYQILSKIFTIEPLQHDGILTARSHSHQLKYAVIIYMLGLREFEGTAHIQDVLGFLLS